MIYKIPIIGFIYAAIQISKAQAAHGACHAAWLAGSGHTCWAEYEATWPPFDRFFDSMLWTVGFCLIGILVCRLIIARSSHD